MLDFKQKNNADLVYLYLGQHILQYGHEVPTRAKVDGQNVCAKSLFGYTLSFDLAEGFPLLTCRKISWKNTVHELIWFLGKDTNIQYLLDNNVHIWDSWTTDRGDVGPLYPKQLRKFTNDYYEVDQVQMLIDNIKKVKENPFAGERRRLVLTTWNPADFMDLLPHQLYPCHGLSTIFNITGDVLSLTTMQRSADYFLGLAQNIASYALLLSLIAHLTDLKPGRVIYNLADVHVYSNHYDQVETLLKRETHELPSLNIDNSLDCIDDVKYEHFSLIGYKHSGVLRGEVAV